jgi:GT2 family glycosyltransferase
MTEQGRGASSDGRPLVSIVTAVLNGGATLARAIESVLAQTHRPIEHVVIDGGSTDGTVELLRRYDQRLAHWQSEPDRGISDGFNKGLARANGACVGFLNADDWLEPDQIERGVAALGRSDAAFVFGDLTYHAPDGRTLYTMHGDPDYALAIDRGMPNVNHPTLLARREVFEAVGGFEPAYHYAMDYDWLLRAHRAGLRGVYDPAVRGHMTLDGATDRHWRRALAEVRRVGIAHGVPSHRAWWWYLRGIAKGSGRRSLERWAPTPMQDALRRVVNPHYGPRV